LASLLRGYQTYLGFFQQKGDQAHERKMAEMQNQQQMAMAEKGFILKKK
jgi:hypothetical protein